MRLWHLPRVVLRVMTVTLTELSAFVIAVETACLCRYLTLILPHYLKSKISGLMMLLAGFCTVAQFSFWGNYLPRVFPTHLRGTGEGFAANIGGRMLGTSFAYVTTAIVAPLMSGSAAAQLASAAGFVALFVYVCGFALSFVLPEPESEELPE